MSFLVDANENRDVATADVAEVFLKSVMEEDVLMRLAGEEIDILIEADPSLITGLTYEKG